MLSIAAIVPEESVGVSCVGKREAFHPALSRSA
jgi:hypothetical protein